MNNEQIESLMRRMYHHTLVPTITADSAVVVLTAKELSDLLVAHELLRQVGADGAPKSGHEALVRRDILNKVRAYFGISPF